MVAVAFYDSLVFPYHRSLPCIIKFKAFSIFRYSGKILGKCTNVYTSIHPTLTTPHTHTVSIITEREA